MAQERRDQTGPDVVRDIIMRAGGPKTRFALAFLAFAGLHATGSTIVEGGYLVGTTFIPTAELAKVTLATLMLVNGLFTQYHQGRTR